MFETTPFTEQLRSLCLESKSGTLQVGSAQRTWRIHCHAGEIRWVDASPVWRTEEMPSDPVLALKKLLLDLASQDVLELTFTEGVESPPRNAAAFQLPMRELLASLAWNEDITAYRDRWIASNEMLRLSAAAMTNETSKITPEEGFLLSRLEAPTRLPDLLSISPFSETDTLRHLYTLYLLGFVEGLSAPSGTQAPKPIPSATAPRRTPPRAPSDSDDLLALTREIEGRSYLISHGSFYDLLDVSRQASQEEIRAAYHTLAKKFHPDRYKANAPDSLHEQLVNLFSHLSEAYETLADPAKRSAYDQHSTATPSPASAPQITAKTRLPDQLAAESFAHGERFFQQREFARAVPFLREAVRLKPNQSKYRILLAKSLAAIPQHGREAEEEFRKLIELHPRQADYYVLLGSFYKSINLPSRARKLFLQALEIDSTHRQALQEMGESPPEEEDRKGFQSQLKRLFRKK